jgi:hypothetical protein
VLEAAALARWNVRQMVAATELAASRAIRSIAATVPSAHLVLRWYPTMSLPDPANSCLLRKLHEVDPVRLLYQYDLAPSEDVQ